MSSWTSASTVRPSAVQLDGQSGGSRPVVTIDADLVSGALRYFGASV